MSERYILDGIKNLVPFVPYEKAIYSLNIDATQSHVIIGEDVQVGSILFIKILNSSTFSLYATNNSGRDVRFMSLKFSENSNTIYSYTQTLSSGGSGLAVNNTVAGNYVLMFVALDL